MDNYTWPVIFATSAAINVTGYKLYAGDNASCLPTQWELRAKLNDDDDWTVIDSRDESVNSADAMPREAGAYKEYTLAADKQGFYRYFNLFVTGVVNVNSGRMELGEIEMVGDLENQKIVNPTFTNVTLTASEPTSTVCGPVTFEGTYTSTTFTETNQSILFLGAKNTLYYPLEGAHIGAFRAYFQLNGIRASPDPSEGGENCSPSPNPSEGGESFVRAFVLNFFDEQSGEAELGDDSEASGITPTCFTNDTNSSDAWYDLRGRKLRGKPTQRGIYINKGRKIVICSDMSGE